MGSETRNKLELAVIKQNLWRMYMEEGKEILAATPSSILPFGRATLIINKKKDNIHTFSSLLPLRQATSII